MKPILILITTVAVILLIGCASAPLIQPHFDDPYVSVEGGVFVPGHNDMQRQIRILEPNQKQIHALIAGRYEVTIADYMKFADEYPEYMPVWLNDTFYDLENGFYKETYKKAVGRPYELYPVTGVSWFGTLHYCNWLSKREGLDTVYAINEYNVEENTEANGYRLPTSDEWEWLARGGLIGTDTQFSGDIRWENVGWYYDNAFGRVQPVGQLKPNELGIYDMSGGVAEWCYDTKQVKVEDPLMIPALVGANISLGTDYKLECVVRGGSFQTLPEYLSLWDKKRYENAYHSYPDVGFRVVRTGSR